MNLNLNKIKQDLSNNSVNKNINIFRNKKLNYLFETIIKFFLGEVAMERVLRLRILR